MTENCVAKKCKFCGQETTTRKGCCVCEDCKTVCFPKKNKKKIESEEIRSRIADYLNCAQTKIMEKQDMLHAIEQKDILGEALSKEEQEIRNNLNEFQRIRTELNHYIETNTELEREEIRRLLYQLLVLSEWFEKAFDIECYSIV